MAEMTRISTGLALLAGLGGVTILWLATRAYAYASSPEELVEPTVSIAWRQTRYAAGGLAECSVWVLNPNPYLLDVSGRVRFPGMGVGGEISEATLKPNQRKAWTGIKVPTPPNVGTYNTTIEIWYDGKYANYGGGMITLF